MCNHIHRQSFSFFIEWVCTTISEGCHFIPREFIFGLNCVNYQTIYADESYMVQWWGSSFSCWISKYTNYYFLCMLQCPNLIHLSKNLWIVFHGLHYINYSFVHDMLHMEFVYYSFASMCAGIRVVLLNGWEVWYWLFLLLLSYPSLWSISFHMFTYLVLFTELFLFMMHWFFFIFYLFLFCHQTIDMSPVLTCMIEILLLVGLFVPLLICRIYHKCVASSMIQLLCIPLLCLHSKQFFLLVN